MLKENTHKVALIIEFLKTNSRHLRLLEQEKLSRSILWVGVLFAAGIFAGLLTVVLGERTLLAFIAGFSIVFSPAFFIILGAFFNDTSASYYNHSINESLEYLTKDDAQVRERIAGMQKDFERLETYENANEHFFKRVGKIYTITGNIFGAAFFLATLVSIIVIVWSKIT